MLNSGKLRGGRRQMLQLGDNETTALARKGKVMQVGSSSRSKPAGLSALGEYSDSDSDSDNSDTENHNGTSTSTHNGENDEAAITSSIVPENNVDNEVDSFLNEVNHLSASNSPAREGSSTPPTSTQSNQNKPKLKVSMYKSMFVKGATEWNRKEENKPVSESDCDINELPEEPITDWQICVDENTQYQYYWNTVSNEVTWTIPSDYTQYLLQYKLYEEQLAKIPEERREYLQKKKLGLIQSPKISKPKPSPPKQDRQETSTFNTPVTATTNDLIGPSVNNAGDPPIKEELTDPEKQFYSEIEELEKMDVDPPEENPPMPDELPPLPPMPPPPEVETVKSNGDQSVTENSKPEIKGSDSEVNIDLEDIDNALEKALEKKKEELKKLEAEETDKPQQLNHHHNKHKRHSSPDSSIQTSQVAKKRKETVIVEEITRPTPPPSPPVEKPSKQSVDQVKKILVDYEHDESDDDQQDALRSKKNPVIDVDDISDLEEIKEVLESKLEFINTNKKSLTRLQILLIQLQTRYSDYLHGALKKEYFHQRLAKLQTELQEYEKSATPEGWTCQWDRNSRSYFYTEDVTGDTQWEHPDSAVQVVSESPHHHRHRHHHSSQSKSRSSKSHSSKRSKDRRKEEKKLKSKSSRRSERDKDRDRDRSESPEVIHKSSRNHRKIDIESKIENISLGGLLSKNREAKTESITIEDDDDEEDVPAPPLSSNQPPLPSDPVTANTEPVGASNAYNAATSDEDEVSVESHEPTVENSTKADVVTPFGVIARPPQYNSSEVSTSSMVDASIAVQSHATNSYAAPGPSTSSVVSSSTLFTSAPPPPPPPPQETNEVEGEPTVSSSEIKTEEPQASGSKEIRKKKKEKDMHNTNFSLKKKKVSSLVNKWKKVKIEVEKEEKIEDERQLAIRQKLEEWKKDQP